MGIISTIANKKACGMGIGINTGKLGCLSLFGTPLHFIALKKGFVIPATADFNEAYIRGLVQDGTAVPLIDAASFEDISSEDTMSTNAAGQERLNLKGLPKYKLMFEEGHEFYRQIAKFTSFKSWDFMIGDENGNWMLAKTSDGDYKGFTAGQVVAEMRKTKVQGGDPESKAVTVQFLDRLQWDENYGILHAENLDFTPQEVALVNGANIDFTAVPADAETKLEISVVLNSDETSPVEGLLLADFVLTKDGVTEAITLVAEVSAGNYELTIAAVAVGEIYALDLFDSINNWHIIDSNDVLYRSDTESVTSVA
jgi:hypothetical protein